jgi:hypothetical protein
MDPRHEPERPDPALTPPGRLLPAHPHAARRAPALHRHAGGSRPPRQRRHRPGRLPPPGQSRRGQPRRHLCRHQPPRPEMRPPCRQHDSPGAGCTLAAAACPGRTPKARGGQRRSRSCRLDRALRHRPDDPGAHRPTAPRDRGAALIAGATPARTEAKPATPPPVPATGLDPEVAAEADRYALTHRKRAALIRSLGRLPDRLDCAPRSPDLIRAIAAGTSHSTREPALRPPSVPEGNSSPSAFICGSMSSASCLTPRVIVSQSEH